MLSPLKTATGECEEEEKVKNFPKKLEAMGEKSELDANFERRRNIHLQICKFKIYFIKANFQRMTIQIKCVFLSNSSRTRSEVQSAR